MHITSVIKKLLNVKDIIVKAISFEPVEEGETLVVTVRPTAKQSGRCGICGKKSPWL